MGSEMCIRDRAMGREGLEAAWVACVRSPVAPATAGADSLAELP